MGLEYYLTFTKLIAYENEYLTLRVLSKTNPAGAFLAKQVADVLDEINYVSTVKAILGTSS